MADPTTETEAPLPPNVCYAFDALKLRMVEREGDMEGATFAPGMTHQVFTDEEKVYGYTGLEMELSFNATTLEALLECSWESKVEEATNDGVPADDLWAPFAEWIDVDGGALTRDRDAFLARVAECNRDETAAGAEVPGDEIGSWVRDGVTYTVYKATFETPGMRELHLRLRFLPILFIDAARYIEDADPKWDVFTVWRRVDGSASPKFVGYATCYRFMAFPDKTRYRVSQFLVIPPHQRAGHGGRLLEAIMADARKNAVVEVTVEDPAPAFVLLRDVTDLRAILAAKAIDRAALADGPYTCPPDVAADVAAKLALTKGQVVRAYECLRMVALAESGGGPEAETAFRLAIKQRLYKKHLYSPVAMADLLEGDVTAEQKAEAKAKEEAERKAVLAALYNELISHYGAVWNKVSTA